MTEQEIVEILEDLKEAYKRTLRSEEYTTKNGQRLRRAELTAISKEIDKYERKLANIRNTGKRTVSQIRVNGL
jgi:hypothetical protein